MLTPLYVFGSAFVNAPLQLSNSKPADQFVRVVQAGVNLVVTYSEQVR
jgi:hypothetical protein